jgi:hypothetical protein
MMLTFTLFLRVLIGTDARNPTATNIRGLLALLCPQHIFAAVCADMLQYLSRIG